MRLNEPKEWLEVATSAAMLSLESAEVIGMRMSGAALGDRKAATEAWLMYSEKVLAFAQLQVGWLSGTLAATPAGAAKAVLKHYRRKVVANRNRLRSR